MIWMVSQIIYQSYFYIDGKGNKRNVYDDGDDSNTAQGAEKKKKAKKKADSEFAQYLQPQTKQNIVSRRRQNTPESQFNEQLTNIID